jgi:hypothetical protein
MTARQGVSPAAVLTCGTVAMAAYLITRSAVLGNLSCVAAYLIALLSCWRVAASYPTTSPIRLGWIALGGNCLLSALRHIALNPLFERLAGTRDRVPLISQSLQLPGLILVLLGLVAIWWGMYRLGLGFRIRWYECAFILAAAATVAWTFRHDLSHAHSPNGILTILQPVSLGLLIAITGVGLLLHSLSMQMGGGRLAVVMRCIAVYAFTRSLLNLWQGESESFALGRWLCFYTVPWIFAFGASYSCWLADGVRRSIRQQPYSDWDVSGIGDGLVK